MFDIGFAELIIIGVVGLLVIGPERLPGAIRTASLWLRRIRQGFNDIRQEVEQELHNDAVMQELKKTGDQFKEEAESVGADIKQAVDKVDPTKVDPAKVDPIIDESQPAKPKEASNY